MEACDVCDGTGLLLREQCPLCFDSQEYKLSSSFKTKPSPLRESALINLEPPSGTRDFRPRELRLRNWLLAEWRVAAQQFGFQEYDAPILERQTLFKRKGGEDIVDEMYAFTDRDKEEVALRPEMTPSLVRMVMKTLQEKDGRSSEKLPLKWFSVPQCWRFETVQRGRKREFYQWNMDVVGVESLKAEVDVMGALVYFFKSVGLTAEDVQIKFNSRKILSSICDDVGISEDEFAEVAIIIDKLGKIGVSECRAALIDKVGLAGTDADRLLSCVQATDLQDLREIAGPIVGTAVAEIEQLKQYATAADFADWLVFDASVVRGLAYYTGIVFEAFEKTGCIGRAIAGGGRYDNLMSTYGSKIDLPMVGVGVGDVVIKEILVAKNLMPSFVEEDRIDYYVVPFAKETNYIVALQVATALRALGKRVTIEPNVQKSFAKALKMASAQDVKPRYLVLAGRTDREGNGIAQITDLDKEKGEAGSEVFVSLESINIDLVK